MARLPIPGADEGTWGDILNQYLLTAHKTDGSLKDNSVASSALQASSVAGATIQDATITEAKLDSALAAKVNSAAGDPTMGGDLSGTASNAQIVAGAVGTTELAAGAVTDAKVASGIAQSKITNLVSDLAGKVDNTDPRLSDTRTPTDDSVTAAKLSTAAAPTNGQLLVYNGTTLGWTDPVTAPADLTDLGDVNTSGATDGQSLVYQSGTSTWVPATVTSGGGVTDHGALTGLADDDHAQYHTDARGDARYYTQSQVDTSLSGKADTSHGHAAGDITSGTMATARLGSGTADNTTYLRGDGTWATPAGGGGGETNTASNVGTAGVGLFKQKTGSNLEFKKINAGSNKISITDDTGNDELDIDVVTANLGLTSTDVGLGNVNNTSDATKNSATATLTNKTISGASNTISNIAQSSVTNLTTDLAGKASTTHNHAGADITSGTVGTARLGSGTADNTTFLRGDGTWAVPSGGGSTVNFLGQRTLIVAANDESAAVKAEADYVCDGTSDQTEINAALAAVGAETINKGGNGGVVLLVGRQFNVSGPILVPTQTTLAGAYGKQGTWINQSGGYAPGEGGGLIEAATADTQYIEIRDLGLLGNNASVCGVYLYTATGQEFDSFHVVKNLYIWNVGQHGLRVQNGSGGRLRGNHFSEIRIINPGVYGVYTQSPDSFYERIDVGSAGSHGFACAHSNNRYVNCKAWYSDGSGFYITTGRDNQFTACESQDNQFHGFYIGSPRNTLTSCCADSNSYDGSPSGSMTGNNLYDGFYVAGRGTNLHGSASDKNESSRGVRQRYGVNLVGSPVGVIVNVSATNNHATSAQGGSAGASSFVNVAESTL